MLVGVFSHISSCYQRGCGLELAMFVFLVLWMLYPNDTLTGFVKAMTAVKRYWRPLNSKRSLPVLKWTSFLEFQIFFANTIYTI